MVEVQRMIGGAAYWAQAARQEDGLGGLGPIDPHWLRLMGERGVLDHIDAVGVHAFPVTFEFHWEGWAAKVARVRDVLDKHGRAPRSGSPRPATPPGGTTSGGS